MKRLKISHNRRFIVDEDECPFFYLADTAWELFHRLDRARTLRYLRDRAAKRFNVIQAVALAGEDGLRTPNAYGHVPFEDFDPTRPVEAYWRHVDWVVEQAASLGLYVGFLPTWGDKWHKHDLGYGPEIFTSENAFAFGRWIGNRYGQFPVIWILGGDRQPDPLRRKQIIIQMAKGLRAGDSGRNLISFHPYGGGTSSTYFHEEAWLDFNMLQTGHARNSDNAAKIDVDYARADPVKPVLDAEPGYEDHPAAFEVDNGFLDAYDCRKAIYWATFAGACGHTYGSNPVWQFWETGRAPLSGCRTSWEDALHQPGASQMQWCRALLESRPYLSRVPDQSLITSENRGGSRHVRATRGGEGRFAFVYCPTYDEVSVDLRRLACSTVIAHWYDPRTGVASRIGTFVGSQTQRFHPPAGGPDWVLLLDDIAQDFKRPNVV